MSMLIAKKIITITVLFLGVYYLLRIVPKVPLETRDALIISLVLVVVFLLFDNFVLRKEFMGNVAGDVMSNELNTVAQPVAPVAPPVAPVVPVVPVVPIVPVAPPVAPLPSIPKVEECNSCKLDPLNESVKKAENEEGNLGYVYSPNRRYTNSGSRVESGVMQNEMNYTDYNTLPIGANIDTKVDDFTYTFLPPDKWYPIPPHPPVCVAEKECPVCPMNTSGTVADLKELGNASRVTPGDQINAKYVNEKINSGR